MHELPIEDSIASIRAQTPARPPFAGAKPYSRETRREVRRTEHFSAMNRGSAAVAFGHKQTMSVNSHPPFFAARLLLRCRQCPSEGRHLQYGWRSSSDAQD